MQSKNFGGIEPTDLREEVDDAYDDQLDDCGKIVNNEREIRRRIKGEKEDSQIVPLLKELNRYKPRYLPTKRKLNAFEKLKPNFPNFAEPLERIEMQIKLCLMRGATRFTLPNILLVGPPGIGKTYMLQELADALGASLLPISMSLASEGFFLTGLQRGYSSTTPGQLAKSMAKSRHVNPFVLLDEIDKSGWIGRDGRIGMQGPILQMFDAGSAAAVEDLCLETTLDLSEVNYICTANSIEEIPEPVLSRMSVFNIPKASGEMLQSIVEAVLTKAIEVDLGISDITIYATPDVSTVFSDAVSPRTIRNAAAAIIAPQLLAFPDRDIFYICADDILPHLPKAEVSARTIGFHA